MEGVADTPEGCAAVQQDLGRLESWRERNLTKHRALNLRMNNPKGQPRLGDIY